jgi:hypothetical protein
VSEKLLPSEGVVPGRTKKTSTLLLFSCWLFFMSPCLFALNGRPLEGDFVSKDQERQPVTSPLPSPWIGVKDMLKNSIRGGGSVEEVHAPVSPFLYHNFTLGQIAKLVVSRMTPRQRLGQLLMLYTDTHSRQVSSTPCAFASLGFNIFIGMPLT